MTQLNESGSAQQARCANAQQLAHLLRASRTRTLALLDAYEAALGPRLPVPQWPTLNPSLWELGHVAWYQEYWVGRNQQRARGTGCDPLHARTPSRTLNADALYDSGQVAHSTRWSLALPDLTAIRTCLQAVLDETLTLLATLPEHLQADDAALYFYRLVLFHEDMHAEALVYSAQALGIPIPAELLGQPSRCKSNADALRVPAQVWQLGTKAEGFVFDNELGAHSVALAAYEIDCGPVSWRRYLAFVEQSAGAVAVPRYLRRAGNGWECQRFGDWNALDMDTPAVHLTQQEAQAWCVWAGRTLPTEAQWECAALTQTQFQWGSVWEWTASTFAPYPDFAPHPYLDYSQPWFGTHAVLRGASVATSPRMAHPRYRNFFIPERSDMHAGFRSARVL